MNRRCQDQFRGDRCELPAGHEADIHRKGSHTWGFTDTRPEWRKRMDRIGLPAKVMPL